MPQSGGGAGHTLPCRAQVLTTHRLKMLTPGHRLRSWEKTSSPSVPACGQVCQSTFKADSAYAKPRLVLQAVGGVEKLERELQGQGVELKQVAEWLQAMQASSTAITAHLVQVSLQVDHLEGTVKQRFDGIHSTLQSVLAYITAKPAPSQRQQQPRPVFVIPRSELRYTEADLEQAAGGAFGQVVKAARDQGSVALKIYRHRGLGKKDRTRVVQEALLLARASHQNVVRCFGVVHDPDRPNHPSNIDGSLVMEWVYGGDLYQWLQDNDNISFRERLLLATQVGLLGGGVRL
jgi:hypothetical protein